MLSHESYHVQTKQFPGRLATVSKSEVLAKVDDLGDILIIVSGTLLEALPKTVEALCKDENNKAFTWHGRQQGVVSLGTETAS